MKTLYVLMIILLLVLIARHARGYFLSKVEKPEMEVTQQLGNISVVTMPAQIVASVRTQGNVVDAPSQAFRQLAGFIFGDNKASGKIAMTAPVTSTVVESQKIAMTAPVTSSSVGEGIIETAFIMPSERTMETLPVPNNKNITIKEVPSSQKAVWRFSGYATQGAVTKQQQLFLQALEDSSLRRSGEPTLAQYNDPGTPPWMRRNELWVSVE